MHAVADRMSLALVVANALAGFAAPTRALARVADAHAAILAATVTRARALRMIVQARAAVEEVVHEVTIAVGQDSHDHC